MEQIRIGFVGAGYIAGVHHQALLEFPDVAVVAVADPDVERAQAFAARCGGAAYTGAQEMLDRERLDALYICVPPFAHGAPESAALERGLPFFVEKPLAADLATAERIADEVTARGLVTAAGYHWRYLDTTERAQELLSRNPPRLALGYWLDVTPPPAWWLLEAASGGQLVEQTTHIFDLVRLLVGEVTRVYAIGSRTSRPAYPTADICDVSAAMLDFDTGAVGTIASTCLLSWRHLMGLHLVCEGMVIELSEIDPNAVTGPAPAVPAGHDGTEAGSLSRWRLVVDQGQGRPIYQARGDPFAREDRDFIDAVRGKANRIRVPYHEALRTHRLATTVARSAREGCILDFRAGTTHG